ncbi:hypothetical protein FM076_16660 [Streptomyces albus subsp. chlorinus]|nr:hypothetical protein [Streptomyces albus subsp. chlorinus]
MAERSTAAVGVAETSGENGEPLTAQQDGATGDGATDATNGHSRGAGTPAFTEPPAAPSGSTRPASRPRATPPERTTEDKRIDDHAADASQGPDGSTDEDAEDASEEGSDDDAYDAPADSPVTSASAAPASDSAGTHAEDKGRRENSRENKGTKGTSTGADGAAAKGTAENSAKGSAGKSAEDSGGTGKDAKGDKGDKSAKDDKKAKRDSEDSEGAKDGGTDGAKDEKDGAKDAKGSGKEDKGGSKNGSGDGGSRERSAQPPAEVRVPELHSGHKLARRYRLEECVTRLDGFSSWRAVDEKLRRAVGVHVLPAGHSRARQVLSAARSAALLGDPRFVQVLDAVEEDDLVYVVHEWLPDAVPLSELLATGPLEPHEAYQLVSQLSQALSAAHREGLAHLRLNPSCVLRTGMGQYRIRGLAVNAALRGVTSEHPQRDDTEAIGALLYAALTQRWPYEEGAHGLPGVGSLDLGTLPAPEQVRAGIHRGLSTLAMRALVNDGATASRQEQPCATPEELAKAVSALPRIRPPEPAFTAPPVYQRPSFQKGPGAAGAAAGVPPARPGAEPPAPPALPGRTGKVLKWGVSALLIAALGLGSWQVADALLKGDPGEKRGSKQVQVHEAPAPTGRPVKIEDAKDFDPPPQGDGSENPRQTREAIDGKPNTYWRTRNYYGHADFGNLKPGAGLILDLGKVQQVSTLKVDFIGKTSADFLAAPSDVGSMPTSLGQFSKVTSGSGEHLTLKAKKPIKTRYVLVWLTELPLSTDGNYRGRVTEAQVLS